MFADLLLASSLEFRVSASSASDLAVDEPIRSDVLGGAGRRGRCRGGEAGRSRSRLPRGPVTVATPHLPNGWGPAQTQAALQLLLSSWAAQANTPVVRWYYTPMMLPYSRHISAICTIYDCMDELANFRYAPSELKSLEQELLVERGPGVHRRRQPSRSQARTARRRPSLPLQRRPRPLLPGAPERRPRAGRPSRAALPKARLLRRHRRAARPRPAAMLGRASAGLDAWS